MRGDVGWRAAEPDILVSDVVERLLLQNRGSLPRGSRPAPSQLVESVNTVVGPGDPGKSGLVPSVPMKRVR